MKIAMMTAWNTTSGVAMHAEPIVKAMRKMGHDVVVFSFISTDCHGEFGTAKDEKYVIRCFGTSRHTNFLDPRPFVDHDYDILVVEDLGMLPINKLADIFPVLKRKAKLIHVVHENHHCEKSWFYKFDWDKVVFFDHRQDFVKKSYPDAEYIPFPCYPKRTGDKIKARKRLKLPLDRKIIYSFGHRGYEIFYRSLPKELRSNTLLLQMIRPDYQMLESLTPHEWRMIKQVDVLTTKMFDDYLFASDAVIVHKFRNQFDAVVSSTVFQALGAGCPIFVPKESDFFQSWTNELIHYKDTVTLSRELQKLFKDHNKKELLISRAHKFVDENSPEVIAKQFLDIFNKMLNE